MNTKTCKDLNCPRLVTATTAKGLQPYAKCNQQIPDEAPYWEDCRSVSREKCKELRNVLKERREVQE